MKNLIRLIIVGLFMLAIPKTKAQTYMGMGGNPNVLELTLGHLTDSDEGNIDVSANLTVPASKASTPMVYYLNVGKCIYLTKMENNNFVITPSIGVGRYSYTDFSLYHDAGIVKKITGVKPVYKIEVGKDMHIGRLSMNVYHCKEYFVTVSMKVFFMRVVIQ